MFFGRCDLVFGLFALVCLNGTQEDICDKYGAHWSRDGWEKLAGKTNRHKNIILQKFRKTAVVQKRQYNNGCGWMFEVDSEAKQMSLPTTKLFVNYDTMTTLGSQLNCTTQHFNSFHLHSFCNRKMKNAVTRRTISVMLRWPTTLRSTITS